ncbi:hypothetical protein [Desulfosporosinus metallidurans]|uniref:Regulatory sensor-transducer, BlaR1/MecR1 family n=1 Tax=Desulfosporosinus metallidurans TaxID=1888891 RepID=A0A1Q8QNN2_9FIRM|nr:hypothetical protein [Desulfosporosinus metallidurans]OLN28951.1 Regulatory sensor-transducer, BlaR1/MecR1 family [Desulfosporosinus metallidurans]
MAYFASVRKRRVLIVGLLCMVVLGGVLVANGLTKQSSPMGPQLQILKDIDTSVSHAIKSRITAYGPGETATEGHIILGTEESNETTKVYTIASYGAFSFENGIFTKVSGSGAIPTVITFSKNEHGEYSLLDYKEPQDGAAYIDSMKKMFSNKFKDQVLLADKYYLDLSKQQEA